MKGVIILSFVSFVSITIIGASFWYFQKHKAATVFETKQEEKQTETVAPVAITPETVEPQQEEPSSAQDTEQSGDLSANKDESKPEEPSSAKATEGSRAKNFAIKSALVSFGHESASGRKIDTIILHSSYSVSGDPYDTSAVVALWKSYGVAPHYMIARDGTVSQLVADKNIAYHAGEGKMKDGRTGINNFSIGIEILNTKDDQYTKAQYKAVSDLIAHLKGKYSIKYVVGHDDIAPGRKTDPWNFDWGKI
jgi:hypothetical protein